MNLLESRPYRILEVCTNFLMLNLLWLLACLPVVTIFPATAAMFGVVREWTKCREPGMLGSFWSHLVENFRQGLWAGIVWVFLGAVLVTNLLFVRQTGSAVLGIVVSMLTACLALAYLAASVYLFPVMVNYEAGWRTVFKDSLLFALGHLGTTLAGLCLIGAAVLVSVLLPVALLATGSVTAYFTYLLCDRTFIKVAAAKGGENAS